jgi:hypothetical protein
MFPLNFKKGLNVFLTSNARTYFERECPDSETVNVLILKGLSHEIFGPVSWPVWIHQGLIKNRFWFSDFKEAPLI